MWSLYECECRYLYTEGQGKLVRYGIAHMFDTDQE